VGEGEVEVSWFGRLDGDDVQVIEGLGVVNDNRRLGGVALLRDCHGCVRHFCEEFFLMKLIKLFKTFLKFLKLF
jgi:hypothetical protein